MRHYGSRIKIIISLSTVLLFFVSPITWSDVILKTVVQQRHSSSVTSVDFLPGGNLLATAGSDSEIKFWKVLDGKLIRTIRTPKPGIESIDFSYLEGAINALSRFGIY